LHGRNGPVRVGLGQSLLAFGRARHRRAMLGFLLRTRPRLLLYPFRYRSELTGRWVRARYKATREEIAERFAEGEAEIIGPPEIRWPIDGYFNPMR
jgi:hypothetical protein